ncbi:hypothetical protein STEG23_013338 [Scotinomys teguina]
MKGPSIAAASNRGISTEVLWAVSLDSYLNLGCTEAFQFYGILFIKPHWHFLRLGLRLCMMICPVKLLCDDESGVCSAAVECKCRLPPNQYEVTLPRFSFSKKSFLADFSVKSIVSGYFNSLVRYSFFLLIQFVVEAL